MPIDFGKNYLDKTDKKEVKTNFLKKLFNWLFKRHECNFKKHYDKQKKCYVMRCTICGKMIEKQ